MIQKQEKTKSVQKQEKTKGVWKQEKHDKCLETGKMTKTVFCGKCGIEFFLFDRFCPATFPPPTLPMEKSPLDKVSKKCFLGLCPKLCGGGVGGVKCHKHISLSLKFMNKYTPHKITKP